MEKPRVTIEQYNAMNKPGTLANLIWRYVHYRVASGKPLGVDGQYRYRNLQTNWIAAMSARDLTEADVTEFARQRSKEVCPATVMHDVTCISVVLSFAGSGVWKDCLGISAAKVIAAKKFMLMEGYIGKSEPRHQRPTKEQIDLLDAYFAKQNENDRTEIDMVLLARWQRSSGRRIGETCKLLWTDWAPYDQTIVVRGMKDPKRKGKIKTVALTAEASAMLWEMAYAMDDRPELHTDEPRIFPFRSKTASARYTMAKKDLGIKNLRLHDSRRECISNLAENGFSSQQIRLVSGHETTAILDRTYNKPDPAKFKDMRPMLSQP